jgi:hypothetical protein
VLARVDGGPSWPVGLEMAVGGPRHRIQERGRAFPRPGRAQSMGCVALAMERWGAGVRRRRRRCWSWNRRGRDAWSWSGSCGSRQRLHQRSRQEQKVLNQRSRHEKRIRRNQGHRRGLRGMLDWSPSCRPAAAATPPEAGMISRS